MARRPPTGKGAVLARQERTVTPSGPLPKPPKRDNKPKPPPKVAPVHIPTAATSHRQPRQTAKLEPAHRVDDRTRSTPFYRGQRGQQQIVPSSLRGSHPPRTRTMYRLPPPGPVGDPHAVLNAAQVASAADIRRQVQGTPGIVFRDLATSLVPRSFVDVGAGRKVRGQTVVVDALNQLLNFAGPGTAVVALRGSKVARAAIKAVREGKSVGEAAEVASGVAAARRSKKLTAALERDVKPVLRTHEGRAQIHAEIDAQLGRTPRAEKVKAALDDAALEHAAAAAKPHGANLKQHRQATAAAWYDELAATAVPAPGSARTYAQARVRLDSLNRQIDSFVEKVAEKVGHPSGLSVKDLQAETAGRNYRNSKRMLARSGVTRAGKASGSSSAKWRGALEPSVADEVMTHAQQTIEKLVAAHPDVPQFRRYQELVNERDDLAHAVGMHEENRVAGVDEPVDFGAHPGELASDPVEPAVAEPAPVEQSVDDLVFGEHESGQTRLEAGGEQRSLLPLPDEQIPTREVASVEQAAEPPAPLEGQQAMVGEPSAEAAPAPSDGEVPPAPEAEVPADVVAPLEPEPPADPAWARAEAADAGEAQQWQQDIERQMSLHFDESDDAYGARTLTSGSLPVQLPKARSQISQAGTRLIDRASEVLAKSEWATNLPGVRLMTSTERATKYAGRAMRNKQSRRLGRMASAMQDLAKVKEGSADDMAMFWYAQLPRAYRNADGLTLVAGLQRRELERLTSGEALAALQEQEQQIILQLRQAETGGEAGKLLKEREDVRTAMTDIPTRIQDVTASIGALERLAADAPPVNETALEAMRTLSGDRRRILEEGGRLNADNADVRPEILARELGLQPDGTEVYVGHRLPKPERNGASHVPSVGGVGRVASPQGAGSRNYLVLAKTGRLKASTRVVYDDWQSATVFDQALEARQDLAAMGRPFTGGAVPEGYMLVNPKGQTIPPHWRTEELAQFRDDLVDRDEIRTEAEEIFKSFTAEKHADVDAMIQEALAAGMNLSDLRLIPARQVDRYYSQFRSFKGRGGITKAYDMGIDAVATSIIFARVGYIPKNVVQNIIMSVPHQGVFFPINAARAGQVLNDRELRHLVKAEIGGTGATGALSREAGTHRVLTKAVNIVTEVADDPARIAAFLHEAAAEGVISRANILLTAKDRDALKRLLTDRRQERRLNDIRSRAVDAMADFTRMTPDQAKMARRFLIIPGWLVAGSRYPFHFAATHPIRSALMAYVAMGEPGAPDELQFNQPVTAYFDGSRYLRGIDTRWGRLRTASLNPVSTPWQLAQQAVGSARGKKSPFDYETETAFDVANPLASTAIRIAMGEGRPGAGGRALELERLLPQSQLVRAMIHPAATSRYPEDATRVGRLKRELGVVPIRVNDTVPRKRKRRKGGSGQAPMPGGTSSSGGGGGFAPMPGG